MGNKIKILYYAHALNFGGDYRKLLLFADAIDREVFEPYVAYWPRSGNNDLLSQTKKVFGEDHMIAFDRSAVKNKNRAWTPLTTNFHDIMVNYNFDISHASLSGYMEWPYVTRFAKIQCEHNIFGYYNDSEYLDKSIALSPWVAKKRGKYDAIIPNPIKEPNLSCGNLRQQLNIPNDCVVFGRVGSPLSESYCPIAIEAFAKLTKEFDNIYYLIMAPDTQIQQFVSKNKVPDVLFLPFDSNDDQVSKFYNTIDILAHYRDIGETFSTVIADSIRYGKPVVTHKPRTGGFSHPFTLGPGGYITENTGEYYEYMKKLVQNVDLRLELGRKGMNYAIANFDQHKVTKDLEQLYLQWLGEL